MHRQGTDPANVQMSDVLCDFCGAEWTESLPMVEGHHGSCICGQCLTEAFGAIGGRSPAERTQAGVQCSLCLERRDEQHWTGSARPAAHACRRCVVQASGALHKDPEIEWRKPAE